MKNAFYEVTRYAYKNVPMYRQLGAEKNIDIDKLLESNNIYDIPTTSKDTFLLTGEKSYTDEYVDNYTKEIVRTYSSGSTGKCLEIFHTSDELSKSLFSLWLYRKRWYKITTSDKVCMFYSQIEASDFNNNGILYREEKDKYLGIYKNNIDRQKLFGVYKMIQEFKPVWMILQPSMAILLCEYIIEKNLKSIESLKYIELTGEILPKYSKNMIESVFRCTVANQYGCEETNSIAYECPNGHLHCLSGNVSVEILDDNEKPVSNGGEGEIYVTSLVNKFMPFIRYKVGDRGKIHDNVECKYSSAGKVLELTNARSSDWAFLKDGRKVSPYVFYETVERINKITHNGIMQFQVEQLSYEEFSISLALNMRSIQETEEAMESLSRTFLDMMPNVFPEECKFVFTFYKNLFPDSEIGKLKYFSSRVDFES